MTVQLPRSRSIGAAAAGELVHLLLGERVAVQRELPAGRRTSRRAEAARSAAAPRGRPAAARPGRAPRVAVRSRPRLRGHSTSTPRAAARRRRRRAGSTSSSVSRVIWSGTRSSSSRSSTGQASAAAAQRDAGVGAGPVAEAVARVRAGLGPQHRGVAEVQRVLLVVDLEHQPHRARRPAPPRRPRPAARSGTSWGRSSGVGGAGVRAEPRAQPVARNGARRRRRRAGAAVGRADRGARAACASATASSTARTSASARRRRGRRRPRAGQQRDPVLVVGVEPGHPPGGGCGLGRLEARPAATSRSPSSAAPASSRDARVQVVAGVRLGEHRQRGADRQRDRAPLVGELDDALARRVGRRGSVAGPVTGTKLTCLRTLAGGADCPDANATHRQGVPERPAGPALRSTREHPRRPDRPPRRHRPRPSARSPGAGPALLVNVASRCGLTPQYAGARAAPGDVRRPRLHRGRRCRATSSSARSPAPPRRSRSSARRRTA